MAVCLYAESTIFDPPNKAAQSADEEGLKDMVSYFAEGDNYMINT